MALNPKSHLTESSVVLYYTWIKEYVLAQLAKALQVFATK